MKDIAVRISERLEHGDIIAIAKRTGLSHVVVANHLRGKVKKPSKYIIDSALELFEERERELRLYHEKFNNVVKQTTS